jgi:hypothetical protein
MTALSVCVELNNKRELQQNHAVSGRLHEDLEAGGLEHAKSTF